MIRIYAGYDPRAIVGFHVFQSSVIRRSSLPISIAPLHLPMLSGYAEKHTDGSNPFVYSRFLVPWLSAWKGFALFADASDMLCRADIAQLWELRDPAMAVQVVKHDYQSQTTRKYIGTKMETVNEHYERKNWSSLMLINCAHYAWRALIPQIVGEMSGADLHRLSFIPDRFIGELPATWNHLVIEQPHDSRAAVAHFTLGIPAIEHYQCCPFADEWRHEVQIVTSTP